LAVAKPNYGVPAGGETPVTGCSEGRFAAVEADCAADTDLI
jgi:hypothetical protein